MLSQALQADTAVFFVYKAYKQRLHRRLSRNPKNDTDWKYFAKVIDMFGRNEEFDPYIFIEAAFSNGVVYPQQLASKKMWDLFVNYKASKEIKELGNERVAIAEKMVSDYKTMKNLMKTKKIETLKEALTNDFIVSMIDRLNLGSILFYFSKEFTKQEIPEEITLKKIVIYKNKAMRKFLKEVFSDDLYIGDISKFLKRL